MYYDPQATAAFVTHRGGSATPSQSSCDGIRDSTNREVLRTSMIDLVLAHGDNVSETVRTFRTSRRTVIKWIQLDGIRGAVVPASPFGQHLRLRLDEAGRPSSAAGRATLLPRSHNPVAVPQESPLEALTVLRINGNVSLRRRAGKEGD